MPANVPTKKTQAAMEREFMDAIKTRKFLKVAFPADVCKTIVDEHGDAPRGYMGVISMIRHGYTNYEEIMKLMSTYVGPHHLSKEQRARGKFASEAARAAMKAVVQTAIQEYARTHGIKLYVR